ncbi:MopE-related protein [Corallococcus llansteffanensis]|uniref:MopE-related protein n=1 Tax=Corallococcus llansteffanensis TaxID=2316731 RepID=UPI00131581DB|nr:MopE-related protein [Corallococcus llansteffanensis]
MTALLTLSAACGESLPAPEPGPEPSTKTDQRQRVDGLEVRDVAAGAYHSLAVRTDGVVWSWGQNTDGQLGRGVASAVPQATPLPLSLPRPMIAVAAGSGHSLALDETGHVWAWGRNHRGQAGGADPGVRVLVPTQVPLLSGITRIAARADLSLAVDGNGTVWAWGQNADGELGQPQMGPDDQAHPLPVPVVIPALAPGDPYLPQGPSDLTPPEDVTKIVSIAAGGHHVLALGRTGRVWGWGRNDFAQVGTGASSAPILTPTLLRTWKTAAVAAGEFHSLLYDNEVPRHAVSWGLNGSGQGGRSFVSEPPSPWQFLPSPSGAVPDTTAGGDLAAGDDFSLFVQGYPYGDLVTWGANEAGQLGDTTLVSRPSAAYARRWDSYFQTYTKVDSVARVAGGARHGLSVHYERWEYSGCPVVWAWGDNSQGQLGLGGLSPGVSRFVQPGLPLRLFYRDLDGDGHGAPADFVNACAAPPGFVAVAEDCDDSSPERTPGAEELCDGLDNDCDGQVDEGVCTVWYRDADGDSFGNANDSRRDATRPAGYVADATDCDDTRSNVSPQASEVCDGLDNNCEGSVDEGVGALWYRDADGDGHGDLGTSAAACGQPAGFVSNAGDCNDTNAAIRPGATEVCDSVDNNCNGAVDEGVKSTFYRDADGDGFGTSSLSTQACSQPAGYASNASDCNDSSSSIRPGAAEVCDSVDNNCNGSVDEGVGTTWYRDADGDGYGNASQSTLACSQPSGYVSNAGDCNDSSSSIRPGVAEVCDSVDNNCNGAVDEGVGSTWYRDADGDGHGNASQSTVACSQPSGYVSNASDCNDSNGGIRPGATEVCDGVDNNCNGSVDEGVGSIYYRDADGDGFGTSSLSTQACSQPAGYASNASDCNDSNASIRPGATEVCDSVDNNCNGSVDEGVGSTWYRDADGDGYGNPSQPTLACSQPSGYVSNAGDCNDSSSSIRPGAAEVCDSVDNNCNGSVDEGAGSTWYRDADGDGYGNSSQSTVACSQPSGYVSNASDCNDSSSSIRPGAAEVCDGVDNNCNGSVDEGAGSTYYRDADGDGYGNPSQTARSCSRPSGYVSNSSDCNDSNASIRPGATEVCDSVDNNCNGSVDEGAGSTWYRDADGDGYGNPSQSTLACSKPSGYVSNASDCNDSSSSIRPGAAEVCDSVDNNCNGSVDEGAGSTWYRDADGDGYGNSSQSTVACSQPSGYVSNASDCNDSNGGIRPGATEVCDSVDNNCNGSVDEGGVCAPTCPSGLTLCNGTCVNTSNDLFNCGSCGYRCQSYGIACVEGVCKYSRPP